MKSFKEQEGRSSYSPTTVKSYIYNALASLIVGRPKSLNVPNDFHYTAIDREMPHLEDYKYHQIQRNILVNAIRRRLFGYLAKVFSGLMILIFLAAPTVFLIKHWGTPQVAKAPSTQSAKY